MDRWGADQAKKYGQSLHRHFRSLQAGTTFSRIFFDHWPELRVSRCGNHQIFSLRKDTGRLIILAVFHESMDLPSRLRIRLRGRNS